MEAGLCIALSKGSNWQDCSFALFLEVKDCRALMCTSMWTDTAISSLARTTERHCSCHPYEDTAEPYDPMMQPLKSYTCQQIVCCFNAHCSCGTAFCCQAFSNGVAGRLYCAPKIATKLEPFHAVCALEYAQRFVS